MADTGFYSRNADIVAFFVKQARKHDHIYTHPPACALSLSRTQQRPLRLLLFSLSLSLSLSLFGLRKKNALLAKQDNKKRA
jgi:hypothetical protein